MDTTELGYEHILEAKYWLDKGYDWIGKMKQVKISEPEIRYTTYLRYAQYCYGKSQHHVGYAQGANFLIDDIIKIALKPQLHRLGYDAYLYSKADYHRKIEATNE